MKPSSFDLLQPETWHEALEGLNRYGEDSQILAGGQSLIAMLNTVSYTHLTLPTTPYV